MKLIAYSVGGQVKFYIEGSIVKYRSRCQPVRLGEIDFPIEESVPIELRVTPKIAEDADLLDMAIHYVELLGVRNYSVFGLKKEVATRNKILKFRDWLKTLESNK